MDGQGRIGSMTIVTLTLQPMFAVVAASAAAVAAWRRGTAGRRHLSVISFCFVLFCLFLL